MFERTSARGTTCFSGLLHRVIAGLFAPIAVRTAFWIIALSWMGRACILTVPVASNLGAFLGRMNVGFDAGDHCRRHELVVGINDEQLARPVEFRLSCEYHPTSTNCCGAELRRPSCSRRAYTVDRIFNLHRRTLR